MSREILLVLTGGTICSFCDGNGKERNVESDRAKALLLQNFYESGSRYNEQRFKTQVAMNVLSENMTIDKWNELIDYLKTENPDKYFGIIFAHGTDTLAYTAAMLALVLSDIHIPVFLVSSNLTLNEKGANGNINFRNAVEMINSGIDPGVYVIYRNKDGISYLHNAAHIRQCESYSEDFFSVDAITLEEHKKGKTFNRVKKCHIDRHRMAKLKNDVINIEPYVGLDYSMFNLDRGVRIVVHGLYHSETPCVIDEKEYNNKNSILYLIRRCKERQIDILVHPCKNGDSSYITGRYMKEAGVIPIFGMTPEMVYVKSVIAGGLGYNSSDGFISFMKTDIAGEFIYDKDLIKGEKTNAE